MTTTASKTLTLNDRLAELHDAARLARVKLEHLAQQRAVAQRAVAHLEADVRSYFEQVEAGERDADPAVETELRERLTETDAAAADPIWEGRLTGLRRAAEAAALELEQFRSEHVPELVAERYDGSRDLAARYVAAVRNVAQLQAAWLSETAYLANVVGVDSAELHRPPLDLGSGQAVADFEAQLRECPNIAPTIRALTEAES
jgi:hypothetical protein